MHIFIVAFVLYYLETVPEYIGRGFNKGSCNTVPCNLYDDRSITCEFTLWAFWWTLPLHVTNVWCINDINRFVYKSHSENSHKTNKHQNTQGKQTATEQKTGFQKLSLFSSLFLHFFKINSNQQKNNNQQQNKREIPKASSFLFLFFSTLFKVQQSRWGTTHWRPN